MKQRVAEQLKTATIKNYTIELDESAERDDGTIFTDHEVRAALVKKKFENTELEWMRCSVEDVKTVLIELRTGKHFTGTHHETFAMRREQAEVAKKELQYVAGLERVNEDLSVLSEKETEFLPITTKAYLYLSGTPFKALATGEFVEEQIFNWTYTDRTTQWCNFLIQPFEKPRHLLGGV